MHSAQDSPGTTISTTANFFQWVVDPVAGPGPVTGVVFRIGEQGAAVRGPAPVMGQHTTEVLTGVLGLTQERIDELAAAGVLD